MADIDGIRINKYLSEAGYCSRRQADIYIKEGKVTVNGQVAGLGTKVKNEDKVYIGGKEIKLRKKLILLAFYKPPGIVCTAEKREKNNIMDYLHLDTKLMYVGRLDKDSEGLLLLTNDGDLSNAIQKARNYHEKEYIVTVNKPVTKEFLQHMSQGVAILDTVTRPCQAEAIGKNSFRIILTQGLNRQIRRMCEALGFRVVRLKRVRVMNILLGDLKKGMYRQVTKEELDELERLLEKDGWTRHE